MPLHDCREIRVFIDLLCLAGQNADKANCLLLSALVLPSQNAQSAGQQQQNTWGRNGRIRIRGKLSQPLPGKRENIWRSGRGEENVHKEVFTLFQNLAWVLGTESDGAWAGQKCFPETGGTKRSVTESGAARSAADTGCSIAHVNRRGINVADAGKRQVKAIGRVGFKVRGDTRAHTRAAPVIERC